MIHGYVSMDRIITKLIRDTRMVDSSFIRDFYEWIPEAMALMQIYPELVPDHEDVAIAFHVGQPSPGLKILDAVEWCGYRVPYYNGVRDPTVLPTHPPGNAALGNTWVVQPTTTERHTGNFQVDTELVKILPYHPNHSYSFYGGVIQFTGPDTVLRIHFRRSKVDKNGLPMIPDNGDYKEAVYWYVRDKMIGAGYPDPLYSRNLDFCRQRYELHAARAIEDITRETPDQVEASMTASIYFVPPVDYFESFFETRRTEPFYGDVGPIPH